MTAWTCSTRVLAARSASNSRTCSIASATRSAARRSSSSSSSVNSRWVRVPTWSTPITLPRTRSGTPSSDSIPFSRRIGLRTCARSTSSRTIGRASAATRPAKPPPTGILTPCSTSSSIPIAARATSSLRLFVEQQHRAGVDPKQLGRATEQCVQQLLELQRAECRVRQPLQAPEPLGVCRGICVHATLSMIRASSASGMGPLGARGPLPERIAAKIARVGGGVRAEFRNAERRAGRPRARRSRSCSAGSTRGASPTPPARTSPTRGTTSGACSTTPASRRACSSRTSSSRSCSSGSA